MSEPLDGSRDWAAWQPTERATLCFVVRGPEILLIRKKRGLGAGKINGPGGRLEPGETALACAIRETQEELGVTPLRPEYRGELFFQFVDGYGLHCAVFTAEGCEGEAIETDEAVPLWTPLNAIPFEEMWADDVHWLPECLPEGTSADISISMAKRCFPAASNGSTGKIRPSSARFKTLMKNEFKTYQKFLKFGLRVIRGLLPFAHRKIVLGGTTARRAIRLRRAVSFSGFAFFRKLPGTERSSLRVPCSLIAL